MNVETKTEIVTKTTLTLTIDLDEAKFLVDIMRSIGGDPAMSRRHIADRFYAALRKEIGESNLPNNRFIDDYTGSIFFKGRP